jgi:predicted glycoside hydrolase/deacetylase ChbG (UPF0249 family)
MSQIFFMRKNMICLLLFFTGIQVVGQTKTVQERLGYPKETKLLIIHGDDVGVAHSQDSATFTAMRAGVVNSGSIMIPCPWLSEVADYCKKNPRADLGLHLTLTSEWKFYKWGPVTSISRAPGLVNANGFLYSSVDSLDMYAKASEVEEELRNQVKRSLQFGIDPTHLDAHMGAALSKPEFLKAYIKIGKEFNLPVLLSRQLETLTPVHISLDSLISPSAVLVDNIISASPADFRKGMPQYYKSVFETLKPGLNCLLIHLAYDNDEMKAITVDHVDWGSGWRQQDFNFFTSNECRQLLKQNNIQLITWREIRDKLYRNK